MKKQTAVLLVIATLVFTLVLGGCATTDETATVAERMAMFIKDANAGNYGDLKADIHPDSDIYALANDSFWSTFFGTSTSLTLSGLVCSTTTATANAPGSITWTFTLALDGKDNYKITDIKRNGTSITIL